MNGPNASDSCFGSWKGCGSQFQPTRLLMVRLCTSTGVPVTDRVPVPDVLPSFPAVRWAAAYGSAALRQAGYKKKNDSMIDYLFAVDAPREWHAANMAANPQHYSFLRYLGPGAAARVQERWACGVYYNTLVDWGDTRIKYGVISTAQLTEDLRDWRHLYVAGRLHKPVATLRADEEIERAQQANLDHALDAARLLLLSSAFFFRSDAPVRIHFKQNAETR